MSKEVLDILGRISLEKNIPIDALYDALEAALISASKKMLPPMMEVAEAELDRETGEFRVYANMEVVEEVEDEYAEISLEEARNYVDDVEVGEELVIDVTPEDFGRIAAQSAKQVITQRIREAEREMIFDKYKNRIGDLVAGTVQRYERGNVIVDLGNAEALLPSREHPAGERYRYGERLKAIIVDIQKSTKDAQIILSRNDPSLVLKLFDQEVAEIRDGIVTIRLVAREPGKRSKIAVLSSDSDVDPVGACVGMKGSRVQMVVQELRGERIDIIEYSDDKRRFVANSLKPANIESVEYDPQTHRALLVVRDDELALAIGKSGLNARLASELTGVNIDIISESQLAERERLAKQELSMIPSVKDGWTDTFLAKGIIKANDILQAGIEGLTAIEGLDQETAQKILDETEQFLQERENPKQESIEESKSNGIPENDITEIEEEHVDSDQDFPKQADNSSPNIGSNPEQEAAASS
ncbi:MAG: transcription termination/antitermination protein NusA [Candidatus Omnitrophica bacterium]|nr:transcription termination/antitermination protein NusA [Candidatus Omnitrophota bacterium]